MAGERLVELMQKAAKGQSERETPTDFLYGTVTSVAPLIVQVDNKFPVYDHQIILSALCKPFVTDVFKHLHKDSVLDETDERLITVEVWREKYYALDREVFP